MSYESRWNWLVHVIKNCPRSTKFIDHMLHDCSYVYTILEDDSQLPQIGYDGSVFPNPFDVIYWWIPPKYNTVNVLFDLRQDHLFMIPLDISTPMWQTVAETRGVQLVMERPEILQGRAGQEVAMFLMSVLINRFPQAVYLLFIQVYLERETNRPNISRK